MSINGISNNPSNFTSKSFSFGKQSQDSDSADNVEKSTLAPTLARKINKDTSMMAGNFVKNDFEQSKYIQSTLDGLRIDKSRGNGLLASLTGPGVSSLMLNMNTSSISSSLPTDTSAYVLASILAAKGDTAVRDEKNKSIDEHSEENLDQTKEDIEKKAEESVAPKDADGNPISTDENTIQNTNQTSSTEVSLENKQIENKPDLEQNLDKDNQNPSIETKPTSETPSSLADATQASETISNLLTTDSTIDNKIHKKIYVVV